MTLPSFVESLSLQHNQRTEQHITSACFNMHCNENLLLHMLTWGMKPILGMIRCGKGTDLVFRVSTGDLYHRYTL